MPGVLHFQVMPHRSITLAVCQHTPLSTIVCALMLLSSCTAGTRISGNSNDAIIDAKEEVHHVFDRQPEIATVFIFITHDCPISNAYAPEINRIVSDYSHLGMDFYLVHVDSRATPEHVKQHAEEFGYECPVLLDHDHTIVRMLAATVTPEAVVLTTDRDVIYRGRIDDRYVDFGRKRFEPSRHDLREVLDSLLRGDDLKPIRTKAIGCYIPPLT